MAGAGFADLLECLTSTVRADLSSVNGALVEPKRSSVAAIAAWSTRPSGRASPGPSSVVAACPDALKVTLGEMVYEVEPKLDWDKG